MAHDPKKPDASAVAASTPICGLCAHWHGPKPLEAEQRALALRAGANLNGGMCHRYPQFLTKPYETPMCGEFRETGHE